MCSPESPLAVPDFSLNGSDRTSAFRPGPVVQEQV